MFKLKISYKKLSVWIILILQTLLIVSYIFLQNDNAQKTINSVSFVESSLKDHKNKTTYHTRVDDINLSYVNSKDLFEDFNSTVCYINGTDIKVMRKTNKSWKCECLPGYHGADCGQPEVIWRALLANQKFNQIIIPRKIPRRVIYFFEANEITKVITDIRVNELNSSVDLFVLYEIGSNLVGNQIKYGFLKEYHKKIFYTQVSSYADLKLTIKKIVRKLNNDDLIITSGYNEIPNVAALNYFKLYSYLMEPIKFRLRWSVFGFFWIHPKKTLIKTTAFTVKYLYESLNYDIRLVINNNKSGNHFIVGDLNHFGGWFCELCNDPGKIIDELNIKSKIDEDLRTYEKEFNVNYVEELIENGLYLDGKTELLRGHRFRETYFAPKYLMERSWKYDYLMINIYSKMDYYE